MADVLNPGERRNRSQEKQELGPRHLVQKLLAHQMAELEAFFDMLRHSHPAVADSQGEKGEGEGCADKETIFEGHSVSEVDGLQSFWFVRIPTRKPVLILHHIYRNVNSVKTLK